MSMTSTENIQYLTNISPSGDGTDQPDHPHVSAVHQKCEYEHVDKLILNKALVGPIPLCG